MACDYLSTLGLKLIHVSKRGPCFFRFRNNNSVYAECMNLSRIYLTLTRTPAFWGYPPAPHDYSFYLVILDPKSKEDKVKVTNLKNLPKFQILTQTLHVTHLMKLLDKICKYEMDPTSIVEDTEWTRFCPQTDWQMGGRTDGRTRWNQYTPFQLRRSGGIISTVKSININAEVHPMSINQSICTWSLNFCWFGMLTFWPSDAIWRQRSGSTLAQVMAYFWRHQAITWTNADWSSVKSNDIHIRAISQEMPQPSIIKIYLKITCLKFHSNFPAANALTSFSDTNQVLSKQEDKSQFEQIELTQSMMMIVNLAHVQYHLETCHAAIILSIKKILKSYWVNNLTSLRNCP